jgi:prefoldin subunit 5
MKIFARIIGLLLLIGAIGGLIFSIAGLVLIWQYKPAITEGLVNGVGLLGSTLETTSQAMDVTKQSVVAAVDTIGTLQTTIETASKTLESTGPMVDSVATIMEVQLPNTIESVEKSLRTAQQSAAVIDSVLTALEATPLISIGYNPETPLNEALGQVAENIQDLPNAFLDMTKKLQTTSNNVQIMGTDMAVMAETIGTMQSTVAQYENVVGGYQASLDQLQRQLDMLVANMASIVNALVWGLTIFLVWMAIAQIGLFTQGWEWLSGNPFGGREKHEEVKVEAKVEEAKAEAAPKEE